MKKLYKYLVREIVKKYVEVEAESEEEAYNLAIQEDMAKNFDCYELNAVLESISYIRPEYPQRVNGWEWALDAENLTYWKRKQNGIEVVGLVWLDAVNGDEGWNEDGDCYCVAAWVGNTNTSVEDALEGWSETCRDISSVMHRKDAEKWLFDYMEIM